MTTDEIATSTGTVAVLLSLWRQTPLSFRIGTIILLIHLFIAITGPEWVPFGYAQMGTGPPLADMSWHHPFGIDQLGRDVFSRVIHGAHIVILLSFSATALGLFIGAIVGLISGYVGGWIDEALQRILEAFISIPFLVLALMAISIAGPEAAGNPLLVVLVVAFVNAPRIARIARSAAIDIATRDFVTVARIRGESAWSVLCRELLPNATSVLLVEFAIRASYAPVLIGSLGFLGFGMRPPTPEWGLMISENRGLLMITPITVLGPGLALASLVIGLNLFTEGLARILGRTVRLGVLMKPGEILLEVTDLSVSYRHGSRWMRAVENVSFAIHQGEAFGLVGELGCGKSTIALQLLGFRRPWLRVDAGEVRFRGEDLLRLPREMLDRLRGERVTFVPQNPTTALNPGIRVGDQISEVLIAHRTANASHRTVELFELVGLPKDEQFARRYPHELSGGQQQRVCIAMALACDPDLVVLDEPTTGLDVTTQEQIISLLIALRTRLGMSMLYVTHDLALLSQIADNVGVMYAGCMVEVASIRGLFSNPNHPYSRGLIQSIPHITGDGQPTAPPLRGLLRRHELSPGCPFAPRCDFALPRCADELQRLETTSAGHQVACWRWRDVVASAKSYDAKPVVKPTKVGAPLLSLDGVTLIYRGRRGGFRAIREVSFEIAEQETFALVGESGSGKSTVARSVIGLLAPASGRLLLASQPLAGRTKERTSDQRRQIQYIFQNPDASLNPRARVETILARPLRFFFGLESSQIRAGVNKALYDVRLDASYARRYPDELSGGERQRVAIARALIAEPSLLLCDEILSALDVSVQANILDLLRKLKAERGVALLFISHDLAVVRMLADRVGVLFRGELMEIGTRDQVFSAPFHPYTHSLLMAVPVPMKRTAPIPAPRGKMMDAASQGCVFAGRCLWQAGRICEEIPPPWRTTSEGLRIRCHLPLDELSGLAQWPPESRLANLEAEPLKTPSLSVPTARPGST